MGIAPIDGTADPPQFQRLSDAGTIALIDGSAERAPDDTAGDGSENSGYPAVVGRRALIADDAAGNRASDT